MSSIESKLIKSISKPCTLWLVAVHGVCDLVGVEAPEPEDLVDDDADRHVGMLRHEDPRALAWEVGGDPVEVVIAGGQVVRG